MFLKLSGQPYAESRSLILGSYVQVIITADRAILPQIALGRPEHAEFVDKLLAVIREAYQARCKLEEEGEGASLDSGAWCCSTSAHMARAHRMFGRNAYSRCKAFSALQVDADARRHQ